MAVEKRYLMAMAVVAAAAAAYAQPSETVTAPPPHDNYYAVGNDVHVASPVSGDVVAAGRKISVAAPVAGDILAAGGSITIAARASDNVRIAGGDVTIDAPVEGDVTAAGGTLTLGPNAHIGGRTWLTGGTVRVEGLLDRDLKIAGGTVQIAGEVHRPVHVVAEQLELLPTARILAPLDYRSPHEARISSGATIIGPVTYQKIAEREAKRAHAWLGISSVLFVIQVFFAGALLLLLVPGLPASMVTTLRAQPGMSFFMGFVLLFTVPVAALMLIVSLFGLPVGFVVAALYGVALLVGLITTALLIGEVEIRAIKPSMSAEVRDRLLFLLTGVLTLGVVRLLPFIGGLIVFASILFGLGAFGISLYRSVRLGSSGAPA